jgi:hypothetical protein
MKLYKRIILAKRREGSMAIYRCFQSLGNDLYHVQSVDYLYCHSKAIEMQNLNLQETELFIEQDVAKRRRGFSSLQEAVEDFDLEFGNN